MDDILLARNDIEMINKTKPCLGSNFEIKDMGEASYVLGIKITVIGTSRLLYLDQSKYIEKMLKWFNMENYKALSINLCKGQHLIKLCVLKISRKKKISIRFYMCK